MLGLWKVFVSVRGSHLTCPYIFHKACVAIPDSTPISKDWSCPECKKRLRKGDNSSICDTSPVQDDLARGATLAPPHVTSPAGDSDVKEMRRELAECMSKLREFRKEFRLSMSSMGSRMDGFEQGLQVVEERNDVAAAHSSAEIIELQQTVVQLKQELNERDQEALLSDLDIGHLPEEKGENTAHVVTLLAAKLGITLEQRDIVFAERVGATEANTGGADSG